MKRSNRRGFTLVELMVVIGILGLLVGILAVAVIPQMAKAQSKLEIKQMGDVMQALQMAASDGANQARLNNPALRDAKGQKFYEQAILAGVLQPDLANKLVSLNSKGGDIKAGTEWVDTTKTMPPNTCSYTSPKGSQLKAVMSMTGTNRSIVLCFDSRNWNNFESEGVLVHWSDADTAQYMKAPDFKDAPFNIDENTFKNNPKEIIGNRKPFDKTFE